MKCVLAISGLTIALVACSPTDPCRSHSDEASCVADKACQWKTGKKKGKCKTVKENTSSQEQAPTPTPGPSEQPAAPSTGAPTPAPSPTAPPAPNNQ
jgi:hypothetical protein